ncbi:MAG: metal-dependent transcriptional regulator [Dermatophilaceae bacterium]
MTEMIDTTEMYLRTVFELDEEGIAPMRARIAQRLGHSGPTVSQTVARMERDGLLTLTDDRHLHLTVEGRARATRVMRKHRLAELLLVDVLGLEWEFAHDEACRWEHVISERVERRILALIGHRRESPYGNPIPGLDELGDTAEGEEFREGVASLTELAGASPRLVVVRRIGEPIQVDHVSLGVLTAAGLLPGRSARIYLADNGIAARGADVEGGEAVVLDAAVAVHVFASPAGDGLDARGSALP